ncbi:hypothetical protein EG68_03262 [Paragonimus skrjabini miyazakii]|uniref:Uncharacterized protein n=1 Tax=Paragonimus skrjabini miyazakii TaxID=59628 RepID=A0A8S9YYQ7_9TREM|nr:hypothetical protein EG68_03262 [Paragonimus skrjabini miyazakii]
MSSSLYVSAVDFLARQIPTKQVADYVIPFLARQLGGRSRHVEFYVHWTDSILRAHALKLRRDAATWALVVTSNIAHEAQNVGDTERKTVEDKMTVINPGFLTEHGEWAACQASLVRLQTSLEKVKTHVIQRFEAVDNLWNYLDSVAQLKATGEPTDVAFLSNTLLPSDNLDDLTIPAAPVSLPVKRALNRTRGKKKFVHKTTLTA